VCSIFYHASGRHNPIGQNQADAENEAQHPCECIINEISSNGDVQMKIVLYIVGGLLILSGGIWFLQGINILPGSFMSGDPQWSVNGVIAIVIGGFLIFLGRRRR
jgi:hypothetical protein